MSDRLTEIGMRGCGQATTDDVVWLFRQVARLREEVEYLRAVSPPPTGERRDD